MNKQKLTLIMGIIYGLYLFGFAVCCFSITIVIALATNIDLTFTMFVFPILGIATIIGAIISKKSILTTRIIYLISTIAYIATILFFATTGLFNEISAASIVFIVFAIFSIVATTFAFLTKQTNMQPSTQQE